MTGLTATDSTERVGVGWPSSLNAGTVLRSHLH